MDKNKKASSKKSKIAAGKGRDVTDCHNVPDKTIAKASAPALLPAESADNEVELKFRLQQLEQENYELKEVKRRNEAELCVLRRSEAKTTEVLKSLMEVNQSSEHSGEVQLEQVLASCIRQRDELLEIKKLCERQSGLLKNLREAVTSGECARCTFRRLYEDNDTKLMTAVQCTEHPSTDQNLTRQVLLNDGRQFLLTTPLRSDSGMSTLPVPPVVPPSQPGNMRMTAEVDSKTAEADEVPTDLSLHDEPQAAASAGASSAVGPCPFCNMTGFATHVELNLHVNNVHPDYEDDMA